MPDQTDEGILVFLKAQINDLADGLVTRQGVESKKTQQNLDKKRNSKYGKSVKKKLNFLLSKYFGQKKSNPKLGWPQKCLVGRRRRKGLEERGL